MAFNNSDPDITIRFREQFRRLDLNEHPPDKTPAKDLARSDSDLLNIGNFGGFDACRPIDIEDKGKQFLLLELLELFAST